MRSKNGSASAFVVCLMSGLVAMVGLVNDAGAVLLRYCEVADGAQNAARVAAQQVTGIRAGSPRIDSDRARRAGLEQLRREGLAGEVRVAPGIVIVTGAARPRFVFLGMFGLDRPVVSVERSARLLEG